MNFIIQIAITAYLFLLVPFQIGVLVTGISRKKEKGLAEIFASGYVWMFALFWIQAIVAIRLDKTLNVFSWSYLSSTLILVFIGIFRWKHVFKNRNAWFAGLKERKLFLIICIISILLSVGFTRPDASDATVEIVSTAIQNDSMYRHDAYSGYLTGYVDSEKAFSPIEMLYAVGMLEDTRADAFVYYLLPIPLLLLFFAAMHRLACVLLEKEEQRQKFELILLLIYWMLAVSGRNSLVTGVFLNCWNGLTLLSVVLIPLAWSYIIEWLKEDRKGIRKIDSIAEKLGTMLAFILAGQLTYDRGGLYMVCMFALYAAVILVKGGYEYGVTSGRIKKHL